MSFTDSDAVAVGNVFCLNVDVMAGHVLCM